MELVASAYYSMAKTQAQSAAAAREIANKCYSLNCSAVVSFLSLVSLDF